MKKILSFLCVFLLSGAAFAYSPIPNCTGNCALNYATSLNAFGTVAIQPPITGAPSTWPSFATVATSGSYNDLLNKPSIQAPITLTTTGSSGAATFSGNVLNIPQYAGAAQVWPSSAGVPYYNGTTWGSNLAITTTGTSGAATLTGNTLNIPQYSGSGTVNNGTQYQLGYYATTGTSISGSANLVTDSNFDLNIAGGYQISGVNALRFPTSDTTAGASIAIGSSALSGQTSSVNYGSLAIGYQALNGTMTTAAKNNIAIGEQALTNDTSGNSNIGIGNFSILANTTGASNMAMGTYALYANSSGSYNVAMGNYALQLSTGSGSTGVGGGAGKNINSGYADTAIGYQALLADTSGYSNVAIGYNVASTVLTTGSNNILIGTSATTTTNGAADTYEIAIGGVGLGSNTTEIGLNGTTTATTIYGNLTIPSGSIDSTSTGTVDAQTLHLYSIGTSITASNVVNSATQYQIGGYTTGNVSISGVAGLSTDSSGNDLTAAGKISIGTTTLGSSALNVNGGVSVGTSYQATAAPTNGAIIQGSVGIGTNSPGNTLEVNGTGIKIDSGTPGTTTGSLYNSGGTLYWSGTAINTASGAAVRGNYTSLTGAQASSTTATWTAQQLALTNSSGVPYIAGTPASPYSCTINTTASVGAVTGLDTGTLTNATWYNVYAIYNGTTATCEFSASATAPTLVSGYTYSSTPIGAFYYTTGSGIAAFKQLGHNVIDAPHPLRVTLGKVIIDRNKMCAFPIQGIKIQA